jgi:CubicO group peptidase (beta-lactamase class C family)
MIAVTDTHDVVVEAMRRHSLSGVAVAVTQKGKQPDIVCIGSADDTAGRDITPATVFRIASISKTMTAVGLMQLRDQGLFALDDAVNDYLKGITIAPPPGAPDVTFRHLLTHTSGIGEMPSVRSMVRREVWGLGRRGDAPADLPQVYGGRFPTEVAAGSKWAYANHAFVLLGQLVEDISGVPFADYMQERIFAPLKMANTDYVRSERVAGELATGHHWVLGRFRPVRDYDMTMLGAGAVLSCLTDMITYTSWLAASSGVRRGSSVLKAATLTEMMAPQYSIDPRLPGMGLAFFLSTCGEHAVAGHDGNMPDFASSMLAAPSAGTGVVVLTNTGTLLGAHRLASTVLHAVLGVEQPAERVPKASVPVQPQLWNDLTGCYAPKAGFLTNLRFWQMMGGEVQIVVRKRQLTLKALSPLSAIRQGVELHRTDASDPLEFAFTFDGIVVPVAFERDFTGAVTRLFVGGPAHAILSRRPLWKSSRLRVRVASVAAMAALHRARLRRERRRRA